MLNIIKKHKINALLIFLIAISTGLNVLSYNMVRKSSFIINRQFLYPVGLKAYLKSNAKDASQEISQPCIVLLGDSRSYFWPSPETQDHCFINRGICGETSAQTLLRFHHHVAYLKPDIILLQTGVNDFTMVPPPPKTTRDVTESCKDNIRLIVENARDIGSKVIISTVFPLGKKEISILQTWTSPGTQAIAACIDEVNSYIRSLDQYPDITVLDAYAELVENGRVKADYSEDMLHINEKGYERLNKKLIMVLDQL